MGGSSSSIEVRFGSEMEVEVEGGEGVEEGGA